MAYLIRNKLGVWGEKVAREAYLARGYVLVARNIYNNRGKMLGELDLVFRSEKQIIFVEVKTRRSDKFGTAAASVSRAKQRKLIHSVNWFLNRYPHFKSLRPRIDVCAIDFYKLDKTHANVIIIPSAVTLDY